MQGGNQEKLAYTLPEAAAATGLSLSYLYRLSCEGKLPVSKVGTRALILRSELEAFLRSRIRTGVQEKQLTATSKVSKRLI